MQIPETMKAAMVTAPGQLEVRKVPVPEFWSEKCILLKNEATSICNLTDKHLMDGAEVHNGPPGTNTSTDPYILGHEICGSVVRKGSEVDDVDIGDRLSVRGWFASGGFADYVVIDRDYLKIPPAMSVEDGALLEMAAAVWLMVEQVVRLGDTVCLLGHGGAGNYFRRMIRAAGAARLFVVEPIADRRQYALEQGADAVIDPYGEDPVARIESLTDGEGVDVCIDACGEPDTINLMSRLPRRLGRVGMFGVPTEPVPDGNFFWIHEKALAVYSAGHHYDYTEWAHIKSLALVENGIIDFDDLITHRIRLDDVPDMIERIRARKEHIRKVLVEFGT
ncbi:zinc-dependent alcohol dehydrogenase [Kiritimatiella glycovorans]|uniref:Sorbitol dehydrogenase n=1 Tax=Kiritimatiella glycovorans TaxID=1307763 RepID=A0A0G3EDS7_9BACT|nr:zinc-binding dehydrogenase [Kiritimatiella glycovorans]AKJ64606.1 Sorbitol dehydrogenase [Kiritimatiella glycovorans]